jgi:hypothetical protein
MEGGDREWRWWCQVGLRWAFARAALAWLGRASVERQGGGGGV